MFHFWIGWNPNQTHKKYTKFCSCFQLFWKKDKKKNIKNRTTHQKKCFLWKKKLLLYLLVPYTMSWLSLFAIINYHIYTKNYAIMTKYIDEYELSKKNVEVPKFIIIFTSGGHQKISWNWISSIPIFHKFLDTKK